MKTIQLQETQLAELFRLREKCIAQAAVIEKLRCILEQLACLGNGGKHGNSIGNTIAKDALAIPTDSKQILAEWLDKQLGEPVAATFTEFSQTHVSPWHKHFATKCYEHWIPLFKKPEIK